MRRGGAPTVPWRYRFARGSAVSLLICVVSWRWMRAAEAALFGCWKPTPRRVCTRWGPARTTGTERIRRCFRLLSSRPKLALLVLASALSRWADSLHGAAADSENRLVVWGANRNGELGLGVRSRKGQKKFTPVLSASWERIKSEVAPGDASDANDIVHIACTRGQPNPKNDFADPTGKEGPRDARDNGRGRALHRRHVSQRAGLRPRVQGDEARAGPPVLLPRGFRV